MPKLRALTSWSGRKAGEEFDASEADARVLCAPDGLAGQRAILVDRAMKAAELAEAPAQESPPLPAASKQQQDNKRRYLRRDLRAQS